MNDKLPKILVSSIPCWNDSVGSTTFSSLFQWYNPDLISNVYFREGVPSSKVCDTYFKISEGQVIRSIIRRSTATGFKYLRDECDGKGTTNDQQAFVRQRNNYKFFQRHRSYIFLLLREVLWFLGKWRTKELDDYLTEFKPEIILFPIESHFYFNRINRYIIEKTGARAIGYLWDDNFSYKQDSGPLFRLHRFLLRRSIAKTIRNCTRVFAISPKMKRECDIAFGIDAVLLTKGIEIDNISAPLSAPHTPLRIVYTGKLSIGRWKSLAHIAGILDRMNANGTVGKLDIYTTDTPQAEIMKKLQGRGCCFRGAISIEEVRRVQSEADVLLFVESLDKKYKRMARLSFSTKLTDYFHSGKCILAVGDNDIAPIEYLREQDAALVATTYSEIDSLMVTMLQNPTLIVEYARKAHECGVRNHNIVDILSTLKKTILEVYHA